MDENNFQNNEVSDSGESADHSRVANALGCSEEDVAYLCNALQKEPEDLPNIFSGIKWSAEKIAKFAASLASDLIAVKFEFHIPEKDGTCAALSIIFDSKTGKVNEEMYWVMYGILPVGFSVHDKWEIFRTNINQIGGRFEKSQFDRFRTIARSVLTREVLLNITKNDSPELKDQIAKDLVAASASLSTQRPTCSIDIEHFSVARLELAGLKSDREKPEESKENAEEADEGDELCVVCKPIIDPVNGKAARNIKEGDKICVEMMDGPGLAGIVYRLIKKSGVKTIFSVSSVEILRTGFIKIAFYISEEIKGMIRISPEIKLQTEVFAAAKPVLNTGALKDKIMVLIAGVVVTGIVIFIISILIE